MVAAFLLLVVVGLNTLRTEGGSSTGPAAGDELPPFAAPLVLSGVEGDVNLARSAGQGAAGERPACAVRATRRFSPPASWCAAGRRCSRSSPTASSRCVDQLDELDAALRPGRRCAARPSRFAATAATCASLVRSRDWGLAVVHDRDGALANVYGVAVCPQLTFVLPGGRVHESSVGELSRLSSERAWTASSLPRSVDRATRAGPEWEALSDARGADAAGRSARRGLGRAGADRGVPAAGGARLRGRRAADARRSRRRPSGWAIWRAASTGAALSRCGVSPSQPPTASSSATSGSIPT